MKKIFLDHKLEPHHILKRVNGKDVVSRKCKFADGSHGITYCIEYAGETYKKIMALMGHDISDIFVNIQNIIKKYLNQVFEKCKTLFKHRHTTEKTPTIFFVDSKTFCLIQLKTHLITQNFSSDFV